ncbi:MAG: virulence RhuM family protein [Rhodospirillaceae bacterium]
MSGEVLLYNTEDGRAQLRLRIEDGTVWLSQAEMAELFSTTKQNVSLHLKNIFEEAELAEAAVVKDYLTTAADGKAYQTKHYRLDAILAVGYRVRSPRGTQFRRWATTVLRDYLIKGFALDDQRLKEPAGGWDYFDELLERLQAIRASEKRFYQKVRDLFATAVDYDSGEETARRFFQTIQNKMLWAVTGRTAAELILERADPASANMGLTSWAGGRVRKADVATAKNYLGETEVRELNLLVSAFLDLALDRARRRQQTTMADWLNFVDQYLKLADRSVLTSAGSVAHDQMLKIIDQRYASFDSARREAERQTAELDHDRETEAELEHLEAIIGQASKAVTPPGGEP